MEYLNHYSSPLGIVTMASNGVSLTGLWLEGQKYFAATLSEKTEEKDLPIFEETHRWLDLYFSGIEPDFTPSLHPEGSDFRKCVWKFLLQIPYGNVITYGDIARQIAQERGISRFSAQAVGGAVGHNPISIIIPCHRVVGNRGNLTGYAGGLDKKWSLLKLERADFSRLYIP